MAEVLMDLIKKLDELPSKLMNCKVEVYDPMLNESRGITAVDVTGMVRGLTHDGDQIEEDVVVICIDEDDSWLLELLHEIDELFDHMLDFDTPQVLEKTKVEDLSRKVKQIVFKDNPTDNP